MRKAFVCLIALLLLFILTAQAAELAAGAKGDDVAEMQQRLIDLGYLKGKADGDFGNNTKKAVAAFQADHGLEETGTAGDEVLDLLYDTAEPETSEDPFKVVTFGAYPDGEPLEWYVLEEESGSSLLLSRYGIDVQPYNTVWEDITWETCSLRAWLNGEFLNAAFSEEDQKKIVLTAVNNGVMQGSAYYDTTGGKNTKDSVFLLSYAEARTLFPSAAARSCAAAGYAFERGAWTDRSYDETAGTTGAWWWLRSPGGEQSSAAVVCDDGTRLDAYVYSGDICVRPALWVRNTALD